MPELLKSSLCTQASIESERFLAWSEKLRPAWDGSRSGLKVLHHRKLWEWCFIAQALWERGLLRPGKRGLGFGVGREPLTALFASLGCEVVATDLDEVSARKEGWVDSNQHAAQIDVLNAHGLCSPTVFRQRVTFRHVDMNAISADLRGFDFCWSSCSFEHLGSIRYGENFIYNMMDCMNPGGVGVHTTEFNLSSDSQTIDNAQTVLFRERDIQEMIRTLRRQGHEIELDLTRGERELDNYIDLPPYKPNPHLKLQFGAFVTTSIGLIIAKAKKKPRPRWKSLSPARIWSCWSLLASGGLMRTARLA